MSRRESRAVTMVNRGRGMIPWCLAGSAYSSAVVEWVITSELISSSGLRVPSIASIASIPRCAAVLPPLASCLLFCLLPLFFSFCLLPLASPYLPVFHSFRRWPPGTCRTAPYPTHLTSQSFPTTAGLLDSWRRTELPAVSGSEEKRAAPTLP